MKEQITKYVTDIRLDKTFSYRTYQYEPYWRFEGDGEGDFEQIAKSATEETVRAYIAHCKDQIKLAEQYLKEAINC